MIGLPPGQVPSEHRAKGWPSPQGQPSFVFHGGDSEDEEIENGQEDPDRADWTGMDEVTPSPIPAVPTPYARRRRRRAGRIAVVAFAVAALLLVAGNLVIMAAWKVQSAGASPAPFTVSGVENFRVVDNHVWRGSAPNAQSYRDLAAHGAKTVIDLRAEEDLDVDEALLAELGLRLVRIPIRDGQIPTTAQVEELLAAIASSPGPVFVHCGAGVGRTGAMVAAYRVEMGGASPSDALRDNLEVGPPSLEQIAFVARLTKGARRPPSMVVAVSRVLDAPRRLWTYVN